MTLQQYLETHGAAEREAKEEVWTRTADILTKADLDHVRDNVENECRLPESAWNDLFSALGDAAAANVPTAMTEVFQDRALDGPKIPDTPAPKGRAIQRQDFSGLMEQTQAFTSADAREQFFNDRREGRSPTDPYHRQLRDCELGRYLIWSTFRKHVDDPFEGLSDAAAVREGVGLPPPQGERDKELVLLVYEVPADLSVRYPTIADAYTGEKWNARFQCSNPDDPWGYTSGGHPEVVHEVIDGKHLIRDQRSDYAFEAVRIVS